MNAVEQYFAGEKLQCSVGIIIALLCIAISTYLLSLHKPLLSGLSYSFLPISVFLLIICISIVVRTPKDIVRVNRFLTSEPQRMLTEELPRMKQVMTNFTIIKRVEIGLFIAGLFLMVIFGNNDLIKGIALGIMIQSVLLYLFDFFAAARGRIYFDFLESL